MDNVEIDIILYAIRNYRRISDRFPDYDDDFIARWLLIELECSPLVFTPGDPKSWAYDFARHTYNRIRLSDESKTEEYRVCVMYAINEYPRCRERHPDWSDKQIAVKLLFDWKLDSVTIP